ncbi:MAG TPA: 4Fe-4S binding protein [Saprospiraceae bacterium]|nr:4Fe-4S binding protein [Saprospiraceae bacterium]HMP22486.1 4Fe-4S binding protein [Saprospiraceae bacterium]
MASLDPSMSLANPVAHASLNTPQKLGLAIVGVGLLILFVTIFGLTLPHPALWLATALLALTAGTVLYARGAYLHLPEGIKNNRVWFDSLASRGVLGWLSAVILTGFYVLLYWFPAYLGLGAKGEANTGIVALFDPLSLFFKGQPASQWFVYGALYTVAILAMGYKFILKYRHNRYQIIRTISVMFFQLAFAFLLPEFLLRMNLPYNDFKNMWPLNYYFFESWNIQNMTTNGFIGLFMLAFGVGMIFIGSPILTYFYGKRWYCSWVCGCGGLAETAGDPFRHLSDKSLKAWRIERWLIHSVLVFIIIVTIATLYSFFVKNPDKYAVTKEMFIGITAILFIGLAILLYIRPKYVHNLHKNVKIGAALIMLLLVAFTIQAYMSNAKEVFFVDGAQLRKWYAFAIGAAFSGVIGVGFYPLMGSRVWCRFGCPMAAILGIQQRFFSRFRITTNGGQCISCGNCSTYCEMGIDVRAYAQRGQNVVRASCVGCGICAAVCPRGVLRLENSAMDINERTEAVRTIHIAADQVRILD